MGTECKSTRQWKLHFFTSRRVRASIPRRLNVPIGTHQSIHDITAKFIFYNFLGNGYITTAVLREILKELDDKITNEDLDLMIEEIDADGSGTVDFDGKRTK